MEVDTYCRLCEPMCGLKATVRDKKITAVKGSPGHVLSGGHLCKKALGAVDVMYDSDRVLQPLKRVGGPGEFQPVSWDEALTAISNRLASIRRSHGVDAFATYMGNPPSFGASTAMWLGVFKKVLQTRWNYGPGADDTSSIMLSNHLVFGSSAVVTKPDMWRTDFAIFIGANPYVSHSSLYAEPKLRDATARILERGGRVVVIDPRRTETAKRHEHIAINAGTDAYLLLAMLNVIVAQGLHDDSFIATRTTNFCRLTELVEPFTPEEAEQRCGIDAEVIRDLAVDFASAPSAVLSGRTGTCQQRFATLTNLLQHLLCAVTGNIDCEGGMVFGWGITDFETFLEKGGFTAYAQNPSRTTGQPELTGLLPSTALPSDILEPGAGQVRALMTVGANPVINSPASGEKLNAALEQLDLHFSLDLYVNETNRYADYILPVTSMFEREDIPLTILGSMLRPSLWATPALVPPRGDVRPEWEILNELCRHLGLGGCYESRIFRMAARLGIKAKPRFFYDLLIRTSSAGDLFGLRKGLSFKKLVEQHPEGITLRDSLPTGLFDEKIRTADKKINLATSELVAELARLEEERELYNEYAFRLIGQREMLSMNGWLHNAPSLMKAGRVNTAKINPADAEQVGVISGDKLGIRSPWGEVQAEAKITADMKPGNIALPHGWGHAAGWGRANDHKGVNSNILASDRPEDTERISGMSWLSGIPINLYVVVEEEVNKVI